MLYIHIYIYDVILYCTIIYIYIYIYILYYNISSYIVLYYLIFIHKIHCVYIYIYVDIGIVVDIDLSVSIGNPLFLRFWKPLCPLEASNLLQITVFPAFCPLSYPRSFLFRNFALFFSHP